MVPAFYRPKRAAVHLHGALCSWRLLGRVGFALCCANRGLDGFDVQRFNAGGGWRGAAAGLKHNSAKTEMVVRAEGGQHPQLCCTDPSDSLWSRADVEGLCFS